MKRALALLAVFVAIPYYCGPIYDFPAPLAFSGPRLFNPYAGLSGHWQRANFHAHGRAWGGLTNGRQSSTEIAHWYRSHRYSVPGVSNYHRIAAHDGVQTMPIYEHGYNIAKRHQLAIGARKVDWFDFPIWQSLSHQQFVLDRLSRTTGLVALAHPTSRDAYTADDLTRLTGYDLIEIANGPFRSEAEWDAALSSGRPVWAIANDDTHDISDTQRLMVAWNMIDAPSASSADIISSLRAGRAYAVARNEESEAARDPVLDSVGVEGGTLVVTCRCPRSTFTFVGQGGSVRKTVKNATRAEYTFTDADTYIRTVIGSSDTFMYLNPVLRFDGRSVPDPVATVNQAGTWALRGSLAIGTAALVFVLVRRRRSSIRPSASGHTLSDATRKRA